MATNLSLAAQYRPRTYSDVVGQSITIDALKAATRLQTPMQQILLSGPSGVGKTTLARIYAASLLCENRTDDGPCGKCDSCNMIFNPSATHPDVEEMDAGSSGGAADIRALAEKTKHTPMVGDKRIFIIDEAHGISSAGGAALLKTLEEPPAHVVFILATTDPDKMLETNRSRCAEFPLTLPTKQELVTNLERVAAQAEIPLDKETAEAVVDATDPNLGVRGTLTTLSRVAPLLKEGDQTTARATLGAVETTLINNLWGNIIAGNSTEVAKIAEHIITAGATKTTITKLADKARTSLIKATNTPHFPKAQHIYTHLAAATHSQDFLYTLMAITHTPPQTGLDASGDPFLQQEVTNLITWMKKHKPATGRLLQHHTNITYDNKTLTITASPNVIGILKSKEHAQGLIEWKQAHPGMSFKAQKETT